MDDQVAGIVPVDDKILGVVSNVLGTLDFPLEGDAVNWLEIREAIDPRGEPLKSADLIGRTFRLMRIKPVEATMGEKPHFYWIVGSFLETGEIFNSAVGGKVIVEELDNFMMLQYNHRMALVEGNEEEADYWRQMGAGKPAIFTIYQKEGGRFGHYYALDQA